MIKKPKINFKIMPEIKGPENLLRSGEKLNEYEFSEISELESVS
jgi:hypothetical protein